MQRAQLNLWPCFSLEPNHTAVSWHTSPLLTSRHPQPKRMMQDLHKSSFSVSRQPETG